jgi:putative iron-only hydrogenase system regulator
MERRLGFVGIIVTDRKEHAPAVNQLLGRYGDLIVARMGLPYEQRQCSVMALIVDATTDEMGRLTGELGQLPGVATRSMLSKVANDQRPTTDRRLPCGT